MTIKSTDRGFDAHACKRWTSDLSRITKSTTRFGPGTYIVKTDIKPGAYVARCSNSGYWARLRAFTGDARAIIAGGQPIRANEGDDLAHRPRVQVAGCSTWSTR